MYNLWVPSLKNWIHFEILVWPGSLLARIYISETTRRLCFRPPVNVHQKVEFKNMVILIKVVLKNILYILLSIGKWEYKGCWASLSNFIVNIGIHFWPRKVIWQRAPLVFLSSSINPSVYGGRTNIYKHVTLQGGLCCGISTR